jgi:hypothetical protein
MSAVATVEPTVAPSRVTEQYEMLRTAAFGEGLPLEARSGLALFLLRGMWGWARAAATPSTPSHSRRSSLVRSIDADEQRAVIHLFAAMAMRSANGRSHERITKSPIASPRT